MLKKIFLISAIAAFSFSCKDNSAQDTQTPVAREELSDLEPDATFNDVITIFELVEQNPNYNSLLKLINQAQMIPDVQKLNDVTFFAPTNAAINELSDEAYSELRLPSNNKKLQATLRYHIVAGEMDGATLINAIRNNDGKPYRLKTIQGGFIALRLNANNSIIITDESGTISTVTEADLETSDGVIHGIDHILMPNDAR